MSRKKKIILSCAAAAVVLVAAVVALLVYWAQISEDAEQPENGAVEVSQEPPIVTGPVVEGAAFIIAPTSLGDITIAAIGAGELGIAADSEFLITSNVRGLTVEHLMSYLSVRSGEGFTLEQLSGDTFMLRFVEPLAHNAVYNLVYQPPGQQAASHAFQTADIFRVSSTSPAHSTNGIPVDAGIEVTFSQPLASDTDFEAAFSIDPPVDGRFLQRENTYIFAPTSELDFNTRYTITIAGGLRSVTGDVLEEAHQFAFNTQWGTANEPLFSVAGSAYETFLPWGEVFIAMNIAVPPRTSDFEVRLYELSTASDFINFEDTSSGQLIDTFELEISEFQTGHRSFFYLFLGRTLPAGYYVAEIRSVHRNNDIVAHKFIQVSALSVYSLSVNGEAVFWVHDAATGQPAHGAQIRANGTTTVTDSDGIAIAEVGQSSSAEIIIQYGDYLPFVYTKPTFARRNLIPNDRFLSYMYTDRPSYRPNDTVDVFGVIMPRYGHSHMPDDVFTLHIGDMMEIPITLDRHNSFAMRVPVTNMFGGTNIIVRVNGESLMSQWVQFFDYTNLNFVIESQLDRTAYFAGDYAQVEISIETFAGFPVEGIDMRGSEDVTLTTDANGIAVGGLPVTRVSGWQNDWEPSWGSFWFSVASDAQMSQHINLHKIVVNADVMMEHEMDGDAVTITTNHILIDRINEQYADAAPWSSISRDTYRGPAVDVDFTVEIERHVTTRTIRSTNYDHINRRVINIYNFDTTSSHYLSIPGRTEDGAAVITGLPTSDDPMISYSIEIRYRDTAGRQVVVRPADNRWHSHRQESAIRHFGIVLGSNNLRVGQTTQVSLVEGPEWGWDGFDGGTQLTQGRMLSIVVRDRVASATAGSPQGVPLTFTEELINSAMVFAAYFDGAYIFPVTNPITITYDYTERELDIQLDFDRSQYRPGEDVAVTIQTSAPAQVLISVVDESAILNEWHAANFLPRLYRSSWMHWPAFHQFASHTQHNFGGAGYGAEGGGGDNGGSGMAFRDRFIDNPIFEVVQTDVSGIGSMTFTLPDQVTSWRVTAIGLTEDGFAGDVRYNILSTLEFYVDLILTNEYIVGDDIAAAARVFGSGNAPVEYVFNVLQDGAVISTSSYTGGRTTTINAGKLDAGEYTMQVIATSGGRTDAVELPFVVAETGMILPMRAQARVETAADAGSIMQLAMQPLPVRVTLTNADIGPVVDILMGIWNSSTFRTDYIAATAYINYFFSGVEDFDDARMRIHANNGGIPELIYEEVDIYYTARFAASFPEFVNPQRLIAFMNREMEHAGPAERAARLLALAAIGEPVLRDIWAEIENLDDTRDYLLTIMYLTAALVAIGDDAGAAALAQSIPDNPHEYFGEVGMELINTIWLFINTTIDPEAAWAHINRGYANRFHSDVPERINFVRRARILGTTISEVQYELDGTTHTVRLEDFDRHALHITHEQFETLNLVPISGATDFRIDFFGYDAENWAAEDNRIDIRRTISRYGDMHRIDLRVTLPADGTGHFYTIYDRLPSNMRFVRVPARELRQGGDHFSVRHVQRQLVEVSFFAGEGRPLTRTVSYFAMELFEADMADGVTFISNRDTQNHIWGMTE